MNLKTHIEERKKKFKQISGWFLNKNEQLLFIQVVLVLILNPLYYYGPELALKVHNTIYRLRDKTSPLFHLIWKAGYYSTVKSSISSC